jgi:hypothetical protein
MFLKPLKVTSTDLIDPDKYSLIEIVDYASILPFIRRYIKPREILMYSFYLLLIFTLFIWVYLSIELYLNRIFTIWQFFGISFFLLIIPLIIIIPVHELLHGIAFKLMGAKKLVFGANVREMVFYVTADQFVLNKTMFYFLALTPFCAFSTFFIWLLFSSSLIIQWIGALMLCMHTSCCIGDFALLSYINLNARGCDFFTFDNVATKTSYYFKKTKD